MSPAYDRIHWLFPSANYTTPLHFLHHHITFIPIARRFPLILKHDIQSQLGIFAQREKRGE